MDTSSPRVAAYRNLHKPGVTYSLKGIRSGRVQGYAQAVLLLGSDFKVSQSGRLRVLAEKRKNVHAFVRGTPIVLALDTVDEVMSNLASTHGASWVKVTYNPYRFTSFVRSEDGTPVTRAQATVLKSDGCWALCPS